MTRKPEITGTDTRWLTFPANAPPAWLAPYGGRLGAAFSVLKRLSRPGTRS